MPSPSPTRTLLLSQHSGTQVDTNLLAWQVKRNSWAINPSSFLLRPASKKQIKPCLYSIALTKKKKEQTREADGRTNITNCFTN
jgi:hypothetical protein